MCIRDRVGEHKYHVGWHVRAAFAQGRDGVQGSHQVWRSLLWVMPVSLIRNAKRWAIDRSYSFDPVSYTHHRAHETVLDLVCRLLLEKKQTIPPVSSHFPTSQSYYIFPHHYYTRT